MVGSGHTLSHERRHFAACTIYHGSGTLATRLAGVPDRRAQWRSARQLLERRSEVDHPAVLLVDDTLLDVIHDVDALARHVVVVAADERAEAALGRRAHVSLGGIDDGVAQSRLLRAACQLSCARLRSTRRRRAIAWREEELRELTRVGIGLMAEHNRKDLLNRILDVGKQLTASDGGFLALTEPGDDGRLRLRLRLYECDSVPDLSSLTVESFPVNDSSIIGHAATNRRVMVIKDVYDLPPNAGFAADPSVDERFGYRRRSMLIVPMIDHVDALVGVLAFINRKTDPAATIRTKEDADKFVLPYTHREVRLARALASHAAVSIENAELYARIEVLLESFVKASVTAIDQHDPSTAGHSLRVAALATKLAEEVDRADAGVFAPVHFTRGQMRELYFASLLHDFGKITVRDDVLMKAKKLPPTLWERVDARFDLIRRTMELEYQRQRARIASNGGDRRAIVARLDRALAEDIGRLDRLRQIVHEANEPGVLPKPVNPALFEIATRTYERPDGTAAPYLTQDELHYLRVAQGSLDDRERAEMEAHVAETNRFLADIPWTDDLKNLAAYTYGHHEKLNGTGYPRRLRADEIPIQTRILTIADVFDALTESDRPYKRAVPAETALDILQEEATAGLLDPDLVKLLIESRAYRKILDEDWHAF